MHANAGCASADLKNPNELSRDIIGDLSKFAALRRFYLPEWEEPCVVNPQVTPYGSANADLERKPGEP